MLNDNIKRLRAARGVSQYDISKSLGVSQPTIAGWERGRTEPPAKMIRLLANYFNVTTDYLLGNEPAAVQYSPDENRLVRLYRKLNVADQQAALRILTGLQSSRLRQ